MNNFYAPALITVHKYLKNTSSRQGLPGSTTAWMQEVEHQQ